MFALLQMRKHTYTHTLNVFLDFRPLTYSLFVFVFHLCLKMSASIEQIAPVTFPALKLQAGLVRSGGMISKWFLQTSFTYKCSQWATKCISYWSLDIYLTWNHQVIHSCGGIITLNGPLLWVSRGTHESCLFCNTLLCTASNVQQKCWRNIFQYSPKRNRNPYLPNKVNLEM